MGRPFFVAVSKVRLLLLVDRKRERQCQKILPTPLQALRRWCGAADERAERRADAGAARGLVAERGRARDITRFRVSRVQPHAGFANAVAWIAIAEGHHPVLTVQYGSCRVSYTTHAINGLSDNDFICAAKIDRIPTAIVGDWRR